MWSYLFADAVPDPATRETIWDVLKVAAGGAITWLATFYVQSRKEKREDGNRREETISSHQAKTIALLERSLADEITRTTKVREDLSNLWKHLRDAELKSTRVTTRMESHIGYLETVIRAAGLRFRSYAEVLSDDGSREHKVHPPPYPPPSTNDHHHGGLI